jgi:FixJ family two-component response regulator
VSPKPIIAIVEDDESLRHALVGLVRSMGYGGAGYASAEAFLKDDGGAQAKCVVSDFQLPGIDGLELAVLLRETVPVILVTARTERSIDDRASASGVLCLLRKPFEADDLSICIRRALDS